MRSDWLIVTRIRGTVGTPISQRRVMGKLGLPRIGRSTILKNSVDNAFYLNKVKPLVRIDILEEKNRVQRIPKWVQNCKFISQEAKEKDIRLRDTTVVDKFNAAIYTKN
ncbi:hypothetical protein RF11_01712 [Thelohanellus kitauei]|uniref:Large ribosomal subunit protein uL30-like ferredoxin-like fold domain-containing protein n=1 Tax=Thelohanellus kitauei TaxID=669202 RepID=A0A0C2J3T8_THEKT|nr:hypothetical protein RF11_01712 [Thelohanellus kitauei]